MTRVLLVGGSGFLGRNLRDGFAAAGHEVFVTDVARRAPGSGAFDIGLHEDTRLHGLMQALDIDTVVHLACGLLPSSDRAAFERELQQVVAPSLRLMDHCAQTGVQFVFVSSGGTVYGDAGAGSVREDQPLAPKNHYGLCKVLLEDAVRLCHRMHGLQYLVLRPSNPYGRHQRLHGAQGIVAVALGKALAGEAIEVWGDGSAVRDYVDVRDLASAVVGLVEGGMLNRALNIGSGAGHSILEVLALVREVSGRALPVLQRPARGVDVRSIVLDTQVLASHVHWQPRPLAAGLRDFHRLLQDGHGP